MDLRQQSVATKPKARSAITNGKKLFEHEPTRIRSERRFRDLLEAFTDQFEIVTEADKALVRNAAIRAPRNCGIRRTPSTGRPTAA